MVPPVRLAWATVTAGVWVRVLALAAVPDVVTVVPDKVWVLDKAWAMVRAYTTALAWVTKI